MIIFLDTSAWIKFFIDEKGTSEIQKFIFDKSNSEENIFSTSAVTYAEIYATLKRALNGERITEEQYNQIKDEFEEQWENVDIPLVNTVLIKNSGKLAEKYALKGCDAFQLASAIAIKANIFVNSDNELTEAAKDSNLIVWDPSEGEFITNSTNDKNIGGKKSSV